MGLFSSALAIPSIEPTFPFLELMEVTSMMSASSSIHGALKQKRTLRRRLETKATLFRAGGEWDRTTMGGSTAHVNIAQIDPVAVRGIRRTSPISSPKTRLALGGHDSRLRQFFGGQVAVSHVGFEMLPVHSGSGS
jgi:hypothetical protein